MLDKKLTLLLYGADRNLWTGDRPRLRVVDANGNGVVSLVDKRIDPPIVELTLMLPFDAGQRYVVSLDVRRHRSTGQIVTHQTFLRERNGAMVESQEAITRLMLVPNRPESSDLTTAFTRLEQHSPLAQVWDLTAAAFADLSQEKQMALLNVEAKLRETFVGGQSLLSYATGLRGIAEDRLFLMTKPKLKPLVELARDFAAAAGHGAPGEFPGLPAHPDSWKHQAFETGNLQMSFSGAAEPWPPGEASSSHSVDADIDLARGAGHAVEWMHNNVFDPGHKTDQKRVYALLFSQGIFPHYTLDPIDM
jgi:hypothetical protein